MKNIILTASLVANLGLGIFLVKALQTPDYEQVVIETHLPDQHQDEVQTAMAAPHRVEAAKKEVATESLEPLDLPANVDEMNDTQDKLEGERMDFLSHDLALSPKQIDEYQRLRQDYFRDSTIGVKGSPYQEITFEERRRMLDLEEKLHVSLKNLMGEKKWELYKSFRESYNQRGFEKQIEENRPFLFMGI